MQPAYRRFNYIYIPAQQTGAFPPGAPGTRMPVQIDTVAGPIQAEMQYNSKARV